MSEKIWHRFESSNGEYFSPYSKSQCNLKFFDDPAEMSKELYSTDIHYQVITNNLVEVYNITKPVTDPIDLPCNVYSYHSSNPSSPERLVPMHIRDDGYLDLLKCLDEVEVSIDQFQDSRDLYKETKSLHKLGIILYGSPGCGKTAWLREFTRKRKDKVIFIYMDQIPTRDFLAKLENSTKDILKVIIFEEVVALMEDSFVVRDMLDFLDGSQSLSNAVYVMSTNYPESIPENVVRNGRIDLFIHVGFPDAEARKTLIKLYLQRDSIDSEVTATKDMPIVDIREICFLHKKTNKSFQDCVKMVEEKNKLLKKAFGKTTSIRLT